MRLLDKIALNRLISLIMGFIISILKICLPSQTDDSPNKPLDKKWFPNIRRRKKKEQNV